MPPVSQQSAFPIEAVATEAMNDQKEGRTRLVLVDELGLFRTSLGQLLASEPGLEVVGACGTAAEALDVLGGSAVDVVLLDFEIGTEQGIDFMSAARRSGYQGRFLIVAGTVDVRKSAMVLKLGASGIFLKSEAPARLVQAIRLVANGEAWIDQKVIQLLVDELTRRYSLVGDREPGKPLEDRERNVLLGILGGLSNRKIGDGMGLSESSVKNIVQRLFSKARVKTRGQLVRVALEESWGVAPGFVERQNGEAPDADHPRLRHTRKPVESQPEDDRTII